jgi:hypothetical protein
MSASLETPHDQASDTGSSNGHPQTGSSGKVSGPGGDVSLLHQVHNRGFWRGHSGRRKKASPEGVLPRYSSTAKKIALQRLCETTEPPLQWGVAADLLGEGTRQLLALAGQREVRLNKRLRSALEQWLSEGDRSPASLEEALRCLAVAHLLSRIAEDCDVQLWWRLLDRLWQTAEAAGQWQLNSPLEGGEVAAHQVLAGELPLTLSYLFSEINVLHGLRSAARQRLSEGLLELTNGEGLTSWSHLPWRMPLVACWTRCRAVGGELKKGACSKAAEDQYGWAVRQAVRWTAADRGPLLAAPLADAGWTEDFARLALRLGGDPSDIAAAKGVLGKKHVKLRTVAGFGAPDAADHCEWSRSALLRSHFSSESPVVAVRYSDHDLWLELAVGKARIAVGQWHWETQVNGRVVRPVGAWQEVCWVSDEDADYLELSIELEGDVSLDRQILLAHPDQVLWMADYVRITGNEEPAKKSSPPPKLRHRWSLPLASAVEFSPAQETREAALLGQRKRLATLLPVALPEWRCDAPRGELSQVEVASSPSLPSKDNLKSTVARAIELDQRATGRAIACPLLWDLNSRRSKSQVTWRQLTVAEALEIQPADVAVGYRAQCGSDQWLFYRSLVKRANRTVLGQNTSSEFLAARFLSPSGEVEELVEIEE